MLGNLARQSIKDTVETLLKKAQARGVDAAEVAVSQTTGLNVTVRLDHVETLEFEQDVNIQIEVFHGNATGIATVTDLNMEQLEVALDAACTLARYTAADPCNGLPESEQLAMEYPEIDLDYPWELEAPAAIALARACENLAREADAKITNSQGASVSTARTQYVLGNTAGFVGVYNTTRHSLSCSLIAGSGNQMQSDYDYTIARDPRDLISPAHLAQRTAQRTVARLGARALPTQVAPVIFSREIAAQFWRTFMSAISGGALYRKQSFFCDHLNKPCFPDWLSIEEHPHVAKGLGSAPFDAEGVKTRPNRFVQAGVLNRYCLSSYTARRLGTKTTGNSGGVHNLTITTNADNLKQLCEQMQRGLLVTELMGPGINITTGDYSQGAGGFWVENGEIQFPVQEVTIAGNLPNMYQGIVAVANDAEPRSSIISGSVLLDKMMIAGRD